MIETQIGDCAPSGPQQVVISTMRRMPIGTGGVRKYGSLLLEKMRPGPIDVEVFGLTVRLLPPFKGSARHILLSPHRSERQERAFLARHMTPAGVFLDIGGNKGFYTFWAAGAFPQATVHTLSLAHLTQRCCNSTSRQISCKAA